MHNKHIGRYRDMIVHGGIIGTMLRLGIPIIIVNLVHISYSIADTYWLSRYSPGAMAVPRQVMPIFMLLHAISTAIASANLALISQYIGAKRYDIAGDVASKFFTFTTLIGGVLCLGFIASIDIIFRDLIKCPAEIYNDVLAYASLIIIEMFASYLALPHYIVLQSIGDTRTPAVIGCSSTLLNIVLDPFLILGIGPFPKLGVIGAAVATVASGIYNTAMIITVVRRRFPELRIRFTRRISCGWVKASIEIGSPMFILHILSSIAFMLLIRFVNEFGVVAATAFSIGYVVISIADASIRGIARAVSIMVGQNLGANRIDRAKMVAGKASAIIFLSVLVGSTLVYFLRKLLVLVFTDEPAIVVETIRFIEIFVYSIPFFGLFILGSSIGRGSGHTLVPMILGLVRLWPLRLGLSYILAFHYGMGSTGIWYAMAVSNYIAGALMQVWIWSGKWAKPVIREYNVIR